MRTFGPVLSVSSRQGIFRSRSMISMTACWSVFAAGDKLRGAVALRSNAFPAPDVRFERFVIQHAVQNRRGQFFRAGGRGVAVEERLGLAHQRAKLLPVAHLQRL